MKVLHSADWHLDAPLRALSPEGAALLRRYMRTLPMRIARLCREEGCELMLLAGDLFDGPYTKESLNAVRDALEEAAVPVFIAPGNHDPYTSQSPWYRESWSANVQIFKDSVISSKTAKGLPCRIWGAAFTSGTCPALLEGFRAEGDEPYALGVLHADPLTPGSSYCPVSRLQVQESGLDYLALGHIHKSGSFTAGGTLAAWPGCAIGKGFDETGVKGCLIAQLGEGVSSRFYPLQAPGFYELEVPAGADPLVSALGALPPGGSDQFLRLTFTGEAEPVELPALRRSLEQYRHLTLVDRTTPPVDAWACADEDTLEGMFFRILRDAGQEQDGQTRQDLELAAKLSRRILLGQEVVLP